jgi:hypothetical protein
VTDEGHAVGRLKWKMCIAVLCKTRLPSYLKDLKKEIGIKRSRSFILKINSWFSGVVGVKLSQL